MIFRPLRLCVFAVKEKNVCFTGEEKFYVVMIVKVFDGFCDNCSSNSF
jgi:hypothetical protein